MNLTFSEKSQNIVNNALKLSKNVFEKIDEIEVSNQLRVLNAFQNASVAARHFSPTTGYGYDDIGRDTFDVVFADAMQADSALVRPSIVNGTHAIFLALSGLLKRNDLMISVTGKPYDTLEKAIGIQGNAPMSLKSTGVRYKQLELIDQEYIDMNGLEHILLDNPKVLYFQRSKGYCWRKSLGQRELEEAFSLIHHVSPTSIIIVDNCYCEFCEKNEPVSYGADIIAGSLIKNPGGGLAPTGGYIAGKASLINQIANRLTVPGLGAEVGSYEGNYRFYYQGLFMAPHTVSQSLKTAVLFAKTFEILGYPTSPLYNEWRSDIVQLIQLSDPEKLRDFCKCIQAASPVDSNVVPEEWDMPGYSNKVIMAAGTFVQGATSELSADGPMTDPYIAYLQGGLSLEHGMIAAMLVCDTLMKYNE